jgi:polar amino acid transport system substrate-binding protein
MSKGNALTAIGQPARMAVVLMAVAMFVAACGGSTASVSPSASASADTSCAPENLALKTPGVLTLSTDNPAYSPWFQGGNEGAEVWVGDYNNDPANGEGYEGAVAYAIAEKLGFAKEKVTWIVTAFDQSFAPGEKSFDLFMNQVSIKADRAEAVDFSNGYYDVAQGVVTIEGSKIAGATSIAELKGAKLGTQIGTTSYDAILNVIAPDQEPAVFNTMDEAVAALQAGQIDGVVADVPTTFYMRDAQLDGGVIIGQLKGTGDGAEQFGVVLQKGSPLTACVNIAIDALKADGTLDALLLEWIGGSGSAPEIQ